MTEVFKNYIGGRWVGASTGKTFDNINPANINESVGRFPKSSLEEAQGAFASAQAAYPGWAAMPAPKRGEILFKAAEILERRLGQLGEEMTREEGKTLPEAKGEVMRSINIFRYFGGQGARLSGETIPSERPGVFCFTLRKPVGVVSLITPWNFPSAIPAWKLAPALVCGNAVVIKPASLAPLSSWRLVEALHEAGIPAGVVNFITGSGSVIGPEMARNAAVKAISFTGSCEVGDGIYRSATERRIKVQLEMGGKNPTIVLADTDINYAVDTVMNAAFASTGQKCTATSRAIVEEAIHDRFIEALVEKTKRMKIGNGLLEGVEMGPCVDEEQMNTVLEYNRIGLAEGARLLCGGRRLTGEGYDKGYFVEPTVFADVQPEMRIAQEEIFGPTLAVLCARDFDEAMRLANGVRFGLSASILTRDLAKVHRYINEIEAGLITVNLPSAGVEYQLPFGGTKESSFGIKEQGPVAIDFYSDIRTVYLKHNI